MTIISSIKLYKHLVESYLTKKDRFYWRSLIKLLQKKAPLKKSAYLYNMFSKILFSVQPRFFSK